MRSVVQCRVQGCGRRLNRCPKGVDSLKSEGRSTNDESSPNSEARIGHSPHSSFNRVSNFELGLRGPVGQGVAVDFGVLVLITRRVSARQIRSAAPASPSAAIEVRGNAI